MKGLQHNVIEIKDTQNSEIEKILVFLRPGRHKINVDNTRKDAQEILQKVKIRPRKPALANYSKIIMLAVWTAFVLFTLRVVIF